MRLWTKIRSKSLVSPALAASCAALLVLSGCQQYDSVDDLLFAPSFNKTIQNIPSTQRTAYDCRSFKGSGWKGIASGTVYNFDNRYKIYDAGCFKTQGECQSYLVVMRQYIDVPQFMRCQPYSA